MKDSLDGHKIQKIKAPYKISVSLSLSLTHTHTHTHTYIQSHSLRNLLQICLQKTQTEKKLLRTLKTILFAFTVAIVWKKIFKTTPKKWLT